ncbi:MAG: ADP-glyceromanno-heptose 6-epimerase [Planctomycetota bacterium]|jgi:ADP-L-glycero-D-manno-heptose 6-epimerase|nr:ADP-glyceromanno-heptose 6-epimerase [Planctomycetota bacterium]
MIIVTGGAGFIGSNLLAALEGRGELVLVDWLGNDDKWRNIAKRELYDVVRPETLFEFLSGREKDVEAVFHMGAISATTETDVDAIVENNVGLSLDLFRWCGLHKVRFIYASSAATYGDGRFGFVDDDSIESLSKLAPLNAYGWSKHVVDRRIARALRSGGSLPPQCVGLKFFNVYGPNEYHKGNMRSVVHQLFEKINAGENATLFRSHNSDYSDGGQLRDFVYVKDVVDMMIWFLDNPQVQGLYNAGTSKARSFLDLANAVFAALDKEPQVGFVDTPIEIRDKYQYFTEADMSKLKQVGYTQEPTSLEDGVRDYVVNYLLKEDRYL